MVKYIFLDIDGVLVEQHSFNGQTYGRILEDGKPDFKEKALSNFEELIEATDANIVICSSWRINRSLDELKEMFAIRGFSPIEKIVGVTPRGLDLIKPKIPLRIPRGIEVQYYEDEYIRRSMSNGKSYYIKPLKDYKYIIIDNCADYLAHQIPHICYTGSMDRLEKNRRIYEITFKGHEYSNDFFRGRDKQEAISLLN